MEVTAKNIEGLIEIGLRSCEYSSRCVLQWNAKTSEAEFVEFEKMNFNVHIFNDDGNFKGLQSEISAKEDEYWIERIERDIRRQLKKWSYADIGGWEEVQKGFEEEE